MVDVKSGSFLEGGRPRCAGEAGFSSESAGSFGRRRGQRTGDRGVLLNERSRGVAVLLI